MIRITHLLTATALVVMMSHAALAADQRTVKLINTEGQPTGQVEMTYAPDGVLIKVEATHLNPGWHGFHIHGIGDCSDHAEFKSAGVHAFHSGETHGYLENKAPHLGDMPNLWVGTDGTSNAYIFKPGMTRADLDDADGSAFIIHKDQDDYKSQPAGNAGARVACGVIAGPQHK